MALLERERSLADLAQWFADSKKNGGSVALVAGEAGIGKTTLLQEFSRQQRDTRVLWGACDALFTPRPLAPLHDIARQAEGALALAIARGAHRDVIFGAAIDELARSRSLVIFEDVHWADEATLDLLKFLGRRIQRTHSMLVVTYRDDEVGPRHPLRFAIGDLPRATTRRVSLAPLTEPAVALLAQQAGRSAKGLHEITGGNPLFVTELLSSSSDAVPSTVHDAVLARVSRLPPMAREVAELVSVVPGKTEDWLLQRALRPDEASIESCLSCGMLFHDGGAFAFRHELTRLAMERSLSGPRRQSLHAKVLEALSERAGIPAARLAHHADGARNPEAILRHAPMAASQAASVAAHREAAAHYELALRHAGGLAPEQRAHLLEQLAYEYYLTDQIERSIEARQATLAIWRTSGSTLKEGDTLRWLSRLSWFAGRRAEAYQYAGEAITTLERLAPGPELAMAYSNQAQLDMLAQDAASASEWAQRSIALAERLESNEILSHALNNLGTARAMSGDVSGWADLERSLQLALAGGLQEHVARAYTNLSSVAVGAREYRAAFRYLNDGISYCEEHDLDSWRLYMLAWRARAKFERGDWQGAGEDAAVVTQHHRTAPISRIPALIVLGHLRARRGDPDTGSSLEEVKSLVAVAQELQRSAPLAAALADSAWLAGDKQATIKAVEQVYELSRNRHDAWIKGELAAWLWRADALDETPADIAKPYALEIAGNWREAARAWEQLGCPYEQASMLAWYGAEADQRAALAAFEQLGAAPAANALRKRLREQGVRDIPRGARPSTRNNEYGLTRREAEILQLLSQGLRNAAIAKRLFLSTKTVDHHVSSILTKLGVESRAEAIALTRSNQP
jgi:DNA-binding CsgD family transcriptional regulator